MWLRLVVAGLLAWILLWATQSARRPWDDTDGADQRSGLGLHTDARTGCQYLSASGSGITPRISSDGRSHIGCGGVR